jgi:hypothetical protein
MTDNISHPFVYGACLTQHEMAEHIISDNNLVLIGTGAQESFFLM